MTTTSPVAIFSCDDHSGRYVTTTRRGLKTLAIVSGTALLLLALVEWPQANSDVAPSSVMPTSNQAQTPLQFKYFPSEYRNAAQGGPAEEHIQAY
jgi:hypothetical protein